MTIAILPLLRAAESPNVTVIASIAGLANQRYVPVSLPPSTNCSASSFFLLFLSFALISLLLLFFDPSLHYSICATSLDALKMDLALRS